MQSINTRLTFLIVAQLLILVVFGIAAYIGVAQVTAVAAGLERIVANQAAIGALDDVLHVRMASVINSTARGSITWEQSNQLLPPVKAEFEKSWQDYLNTLDAAEREKTLGDTKDAVGGVNQAFTEAQNLFAARDRGNVNLFVANDLEGLTLPFLDALELKVVEGSRRGRELLQETQTLTRVLVTGLVLFAIVALIVSYLLGARTYRDIVNPVNKMTETVRQVSSGNYDVRTELAGGDELSTLGQAFDQMLDDRLTALAAAERENDRLNDSIIGLLQAVSQLSQRDLTVKVPVTEDVTGPVADALNLLTDETAKVLQGVTQLSEEVAVASDKVKLQSDAVIAVADDERREVEKAAAELAEAADAMHQIAELAQTCNVAADNAIKTTQAALATVTNTVNGINSTRDTIRETEKRIKRLGERSQEISSVVNIINTIAERTHILALNASMHAASAGEAGRGFAVVADEVQRLAENSREATSQIATLVSNIQTETADTVNAMNLAITQVVEGSRLAEQAGEQMQRTQQTTADLVGSVQQIARRSQEQARISGELLERAKQIQQSTQQTSQQLQEQTVQTSNLVKYAKGLLNSVRVFKLPAAEAN